MYNVLRLYQRKISHCQNPCYLYLGVIILLAMNGAQAQQQYPAYPGYTAYPYSQNGQQQPGRYQFKPPRQQQPYQQPYQQTYQQPYQQPYQQQYQQPFQQPYQQQPQIHQYQYPGGYPGRQPVQQGYQARPQPPQYHQTPAPAATVSKSPTVEMILAGGKTYLQQTLLLTLRITSSKSLSNETAPDMPSVSGLVIKRLDDPKASTARRDGQQVVFTDYRYAVTPLREGLSTIPAIKVRGGLNGTRGSQFDIIAPQAIQLNVLPVVKTVQPWLPLKGLMLKTELRGADHPEAGKPIGLEVDISAVGATGSQLPSLERQLQKSDFRVYRGKADVTGRISNDGRYILGRRIETFTLVPQHGGKSQIPQLTIPWWNVTTDQAESASAPTRELTVAGESVAGVDVISDLLPGKSSLLLWVLLIALFAATLGFWILAWLRNKRFLQVVDEEFMAFSAFATNKGGAFLTWLAPIRRLQQVRQLFIRSLPRSFRLWLSVRQLEGEQDPAAWTFMLKLLANKHLGIAPQLPLQELGEQIASFHPKSDQQAMQQQMRELERSLYHGSSIDFIEWKKRFRQQIKPSWLIPSRSKRKSIKPGRLPQLNPGV